MRSSSELKKYIVNKDSLTCSKKSSDMVEYYPGEHLEDILNFLLTDEGKAISKIDLSNNQFTSTEINNFAQKLTENKIYISHLILCENNLENIVMRFLFAIPGIKVIDLSNTGVSDDQLLELRRIPSKIKKLVLRGCKFSGYAYKVMTNSKVAMDFELDDRDWQTKKVRSENKPLQDTPLEVLLSEENAIALPKLPNSQLNFFYQGKSKLKQSHVTFSYQEKPVEKDALFVTIFSDRQDVIAFRNEAAKYSEEKYLSYLKLVIKILNDKKTQYASEEFFGLASHFVFNQNDPQEKWAKLASKAKNYIETTTDNKNSFSFRLASAIVKANIELDGSPLEKLDKDQCLGYLTEHLSFRL